jgi:predicted acyl esterase
MPARNAAIAAADHRRGSPPDTFTDDPEWPVVDALGAARGPEFMLDLRERERVFDTLVFCTGPLAAPCALLGEACAELTVACDAPDADVCV